jgi:hypothetical protein
MAIAAKSEAVEAWGGNEHQWFKHFAGIALRGCFKSSIVSNKPYDPPFLVCPEGFNPHAGAPLR